MYLKPTLHLAKTAIFVSLAIFLISSYTAAGGGWIDPPKKHHYFHSVGENWVLNNGYYALLYITYDGYNLKNGQRITGRGGFGGVTTDNRKQDGTISVTIKLYKTSGDVFVAEKNWSGSLSSSRNGVSWRYTPPGDSYWAIDSTFHFQKESTSSSSAVSVKVT